MTSRTSTSLRLGPKERARIALAAKVVGDDLGAFIRGAARDRAEQVIADAEYRQFLAHKAARAAESRKTAKPLSNTALLRRLAQRRAR